MKYIIDSIEFKTSKTNSEYVELSLSDPDDFFNEPCKVPVFTKAVIDGYKRMMNAVNGDLTKLPDNAKYFSHATWVTIPLPKPMYRRWGSDYDTTDANGVVTHHQANDLINDKNGNPKLYTEFRVLCKETVDKEKIETGYSPREATTWANGWDPTSRGNSYISSFFVSTTPGTQPTTQQGPVIPQQNVTQPGNTPQQQVIQPIQQGPQQPIQQGPQQGQQVIVTQPGQVAQQQFAGAPMV